MDDLTLYVLIRKIDVRSGGGETNAINTPHFVDTIGDVKQERPQRKDKTEDGVANDVRTRESDPVVTLSGRLL